MNSITLIANQGWVLVKERCIAPVLALAEQNRMILTIATVALALIALFFTICSCCFNGKKGKFSGVISPDFFDSKPIPAAPSVPPYLTSFNKNKDTLPKPATVPTRASTPPVLSKEELDIAAIEGKWLDDCKAESQRLKNANVFAKSLPSNLNSNEIISVLGRVLELKNYYRDSHYVFTHGQAAAISMVNTINKECVRRFTPNLYHSLKTYFRLPHTIVYSANAKSFITDYKAANNPSFIDDGYHSDKIMSVDAQFWNENGAESALYFFKAGTNISFNSKEALEKIFKSNFANYIASESVCKMLAEKAASLALDKAKDTKIGVLYAICIPKSVVKDDNKDLAYHCHPYGRVCDCFPYKNKITLLEEMQKDVEIKCKNGMRTQYRILTARLTEEKGVRSFQVDCLPKATKRKYEERVKELVNLVVLYSQLSGLIESMDETTFDEDIILLQQSIQSLIEASPQLEKKYIDLLYKEKKPLVIPKG